MRPHLIALVSVWLTHSTVNSQSTVDFYVDFHGVTPPHTLGIPSSFGVCTNPFTTYAGFGASIFLSDTAPTGGRILQRGGDGSFTPVFQFTNLVYRTYPEVGGARAYSYEQLWGVTSLQVDSLLASQWWAEITFPGQTYLGQFLPVPEPTTVSCGLWGGLFFVAAYRLSRSLPNHQADHTTAKPGGFKVWRKGVNGARSRNLTIGSFDPSCVRTATPSRESSPSWQCRLGSGPVDYPGRIRARLKLSHRGDCVNALDSSVSGSVALESAE